MAHLNHDFRGDEAEEDARFVGRLGRELGLAASIEEADPIAYQKEEKISSFEEAARELRYSFLARVTRETGAHAVALGHTADDLAETVLMHVIRGSGLHGLRGMTELSTWRSRGGQNEVALFRSLLGVTKAETEHYCRSRGIPFREDTGNLLPRFTRNRVRHQLLPLLREYNPRIREALARLAHLASQEVDFLEGEVDGLWPHVSREEGPWLVLDSSELSKLHPLILGLVLRRAYGGVAGDARRLQEAHLTAMADLVGAPPGKVLQLPRGLRLHSGYGQLLLGRGDETPCPFPPFEGEHQITLPVSNGEIVIQIPGWVVTARVGPLTDPVEVGPYTAFLDPDALGERGVIVRSRRPGDRFQLLGMGEPKKLQDFLVDQKVPRSWRDRVPLVVTEGGVAWVVGYRVAEWAKPHPGQDQDTEILQLKFSTDD